MKITINPERKMQGNNNSAAIYMGIRLTFHKTAETPEERQQLMKEWNDAVATGDAKALLAFMMESLDDIPPVTESN